MLCDSCKTRDAVVHLTRKDGTGTTQLHLCEKCAAEHGVGMKVSTEAQHPLGEMLNAVHGERDDAPDSPVCEFCGSTIRDFQMTGRLGCAHCYDALEKSLKELLRRIHGSSRHVGRHYELPVEGLHLSRPESIYDLRERLKLAVEKEEFELAAELRDRIRMFE